MKIKILGTRGETEKFTSSHKKYSGILIDNFLFDIGEKEFLDTKPKAIFITHLHPDHAYFVKEKHTPELQGLTIYAPEVWKGFIEDHVPVKIKKLVPIKQDSLLITPIPTIHSKLVKSTAYLIESKGVRVLYTGDMIWIRKKYHNKLRDLDLVITDGSFLRKGGMIRRDKKTGELYGHQGVPNLVELFKRLNAKRIVFTHFGDWFLTDPEKGKEEIRKFSNDIRVESAFDGKEITLEEKLELGVTGTEEIEPIIPKVIAKIQPRAGLYLVSPHAKMITEGKKTLIVKSKKFTTHINEPIYLLEGKLCYGIITLKEPYEITHEEFIKLRDRHHITDEEAFVRWHWKKDSPLFAYEFNIDQTFDPPLPIKIPRGVQVFVDAKNIKFFNIKTLSILDLFDLADLELSEELYASVAEEMFKRKIFKSQVFELIRGWISDYDATKPNDKQLGDDFRICLGWYSSIRRGKKLFKHVGQEKKEITLEDCKQLGLKIFKEMIRREFTFNRPETYKKYARELFEWLIKEVGGPEKVPWKQETEKEEKAVTIPDPRKITRADLENIDDIYVSKLTDEELKTVDKRLHEIFREIGKVIEPLENAHIFVWKEMRKRKIPHGIEDGLDRATLLEVVEYPKPEYGVPQRADLEEWAKKIDLEQVLKALPDTIVVEDPIHVYLCGRVVNEGTIPPSHDIDLLFKQGWYHVPTIRTFLDEVSKRDSEVAKRFHFVWDSLGPNIGMAVPLFRLAYHKVSPSEMKRRSPFSFLSSTVPQLFKPFIGMKPKSGFEQKLEFWDLKEMWDHWGKNYIDRGIFIQEKLDGLRFSIHCKGDKIKIITEDRQRDRASFFKKSVKELLGKKIAHSFILDAEMVEYACGAKVVSDPRLCEQLPREEMVKWVGAQRELDDENVVFNVHDCVFINGEPINNKEYLERWEAISEVFPKDLKHWKRVEGETARDMRSFFRLANRYRRKLNSEGIVAKAIDSTYQIKYSGENRTGDWSKLKNLKEVDCLVWKIIQKKSKEGKPLDQYLYECLISIPCEDVDKYREKDIVRRDGKCYLWIGRSYATREKVRPGTVIIVRPIRVAEFKDPSGKTYISWMFPYYEGKHPIKTEPDSIDVIKKLIRVGTGPMLSELRTIVLKLPRCPFWNDSRVCILKERFKLPRDELSKEKVLIECLRFPIVCRFANHYKCRFVKPYYYSFKEIKMTDTGIPTDEDDLNLQGEED